jgi:Sec-independent protein translocase protein TatA
MRNMGDSYDHIFLRRLPGVGKDAGRLMDQFKSKIEWSELMNNKGKNED